MDDIMEVSQANDMNVIMANNSKPSKLCATAANKAGGEIFRLTSTTPCREPEAFGSLYATIVGPQQKCCVQAPALYLEKIQKMATKMMADLRQKIYGERLQDFGIFSRTPTPAQQSTL